MAVFLFGVAVSWVFTFVLWFGWSFGLMSGLLLGALIGTATIFAFFTVQWTLSALLNTHNRRHITANKNARSILKKAILRP